MSTPSGLPIEQVRSVRRIAIIVVVVSLSISALIGILTLFTGEFGIAQRNTMLSTLAIGVFGVLSLCHLAVVGKRFQLAGMVGILSSALALALSFYVIWAPFDFYGPHLWEALAVASIAAVSFAHANLLLLLADRRRTAVRVGLRVTVVLIAVLAVLISLLVLFPGYVLSDGFTRLLGTVAILNVLGTVIVPVLGAILRDGTAAHQAEQQPHTGSLLLALPRELDERLATAALNAGTSKADQAIDAIRRHLSQ